MENKLILKPRKRNTDSFKLTVPELQKIQSNLKSI